MPFGGERISLGSMSWELSDDHETFRKVVRDFAEGEIAPHADRWDREHHFPVEVVRAMGDLGLFGLVFPEQWGGAGMRVLCGARVFSERLIFCWSVPWNAPSERSDKNPGSIPCMKTTTEVKEGRGNCWLRR